MPACISVKEGKGVGDGVGDGVGVLVGEGVGVFVGATVGDGVGVPMDSVGAAVGICTVCCAEFAVSKDTNARPSTITDENMYNKDFNLFILIGFSINKSLVSSKVDSMKNNSFSRS